MNGRAAKYFRSLAKARTKDLPEHEYRIAKNGVITNSPLSERGEYLRIKKLYKQH
jgi:hypothetical protein